MFLVFRCTVGDSESLGRVRDVLAYVSVQLGCNDSRRFCSASEELTVKYDIICRSMGCVVVSKYIKILCVHS